MVRPSFGSCPQQMIGSTSRMQGKEASEQETKAKSSVGIDVSKDWLDVHVLPADERLRVPNTCEGIRELKRWLRRVDLALVVVEATGKWHRHVQRSLAASAIAVAVVDPFRVRMFAKAQGILAKTDRLDARVLATFAAVMTPSVRPPAPQALADLAPIADQSGVRDGVRVIWGGRAGVRRILYLAALTAARFNADMKTFYQRLTVSGKPPKVAIIAVARKLVVLANTLITEDRMWQPQSPKHA